MEAAGTFPRIPMTQFTADSLARVLVNVEGDVLAEALEIANLSHFLTEPGLQTLDDLQGWLNLLGNMLVLGPDVFQVAVHEFFAGMPKADVDRMQGVITGLRFFLGGIETLDILLGKADEILEIIKAVAGIEGEQGASLAAILGLANHMSNVLVVLEYHNELSVTDSWVVENRRDIDDLKDSIRLIRIESAPFPR